MERNSPLVGSVLGVVARLAALSLVVGVVLSALGITPANFLDRLTFLARRLYALGFHAFDWVFGYLALGAMVVIPVWLLTRLLKGRRRE